MFNGDHHVLYWADASSEVAFIVPSNRPGKFGDDSSSDVKSPSPPSRASSLGLDRSMGGSAATVPPESAKRRFQRQTSTALQFEVKMVIVWLERMEDSADIPLDNLLAETVTGSEGGGFVPSQKDAFTIFIQPLKSGLIMIRMQGHATK